MTPVLLFGCTLLVALLISKFANRTVVSTAVLFLAVGMAAGSSAVGAIELGPRSPVVVELSRLALVAVLFTDGSKLSWRKLRDAWRLPGRALVFGLPLTLAITAALAHFVAGLAWLQAAIVGAVLSPTDPVFAAAIVGRQSVSRDLRQLLNIESGINDGITLPIVIGLLALAGAPEASWTTELLAVGGGIAIGVVVPLVAFWLAHLPWFGVARGRRPLFPFAVGLVVFALAGTCGANEYLAAFTGGITAASMASDEKAFGSFGKHVAELLKVAALLVFGVLLARGFWHTLNGASYLFAALALIVARPAALALSLIGSQLPRRERLAAMWFGPKGFSAVIYGLMVAHASVPGSRKMFQLIGVAIVASIVAHSSTDVLLARWLRRGEPSTGEPGNRPAVSFSG